MQEFCVERSKAAVTLRLRGGVEVQGRVFLPPEPVDEPLVGKVHELLNNFDAFVPVEVDDGITVVQNKERILWCRYDGPAGPVVEVMLPRRRVTLGLEDGTTLQGDLVADGPVDRRRVLDCLNQSRAYLLVEARDGDYCVRRDAIACVPSAELGDPREAADEFVVEAASVV